MYVGYAEHGTILNIARRFIGLDISIRHPKISYPMKKLYALAYTALLVIVASATHAQTPAVNQAVAEKPLLFTSLPEKLECNLEEVDKLFMAEIDQKLVIRLNDRMQLDGIVAEKVRRSSNYPNALFTISRIIQDGTIRYTGRIISKDNGDVMVVVKENGKYYFTKSPQRLVMTE
jgi:hypothetical protein